MSGAGAALAGLAALGIGLYALKANASTGNGAIVNNPVEPVQNTTSSGGKLSVADIAAYAEGAGFTGDDLRMAIAVALAESGGNPNAYNPETAAGTPQGQGSYGLWQIYLKAHPEYSDWNLADPAGNALAAFQIYEAAGYTFRPWATFKNGSYVSYLDQATAVVG